MGFSERSKGDPHNYYAELYKAINTPGIDNGKKWWIGSFLNGTNTPKTKAIYTDPDDDDEEVGYRCCYEPSKHRNISKRTESLPIEINAPSGTQVDIEKLENGKIRLTFH